MKLEETFGKILSGEPEALTRLQVVVQSTNKETVERIRKQVEEIKKRIEEEEPTSTAQEEDYYEII